MAATPLGAYLPDPASNMPGPWRWNEGSAALPPGAFLPGLAPSASGAGGLSAEPPAFGGLALPSTISLSSLPAFTPSRDRSKLDIRGVMVEGPSTQYPHGRYAYRGFYPGDPNPVDLLPGEVESFGKRFGMDVSPSTLQANSEERARELQLAAKVEAAERQKREDDAAERRLREDALGIQRTQVTDARDHNRALLAIQRGDQVLAADRLDYDMHRGRVNDVLALNEQRRANDINMYNAAVAAYKADVAEAATWRTNVFNMIGQSLARLAA